MPHSILHLSFDSVRLRQARIQAQLTIQKAAQLSHLNKMTLSRYETGDIKTMAWDRLLQLSRIYKKTPAWLTGVSSEQEYVSTNELLHITPCVDVSSSAGKRILKCLRLMDHSLPFQQ